MRVITTIPHSKCAITLFSWNGKYILKFEQGNFEQTYKISEMDITGEEQVKDIPKNQEFMKQVLERFETMQEQWYKAFE